MQPAGKDSVDDEFDASTTDLYRKLTQVLVAHEGADDPDVALSALGYLLVEVARAAKVSAPSVLGNLARMMGAKVLELELPRSERPKAEA